MKTECLKITIIDKINTGMGIIKIINLILKKTCFIMNIVCENVRRTEKKDSYGTGKI